MPEEVRFEKGTLLGLGVEGVTYQAKIKSATSVKGEYAIKDYYDVTPDQFYKSTRFSRQRQIFERLADKNYRETHLVVPMAINEVRNHKGTPRLELVFPLLKGKNVSSLLKEKSRPDWELIQTFIHDILHAYRVLHQEVKVAHTDMHTQNVMFSEGRFYLIDFTRAKGLKEIRRDGEDFVNVLSQLLLGGREVDEISQKHAPEVEDTNIASYIAEFNAEVQARVGKIYGQNIKDYIYSLPEKIAQKNFDYGQYQKELVAVIVPHFQANGNP